MYKLIISVLTVILCIVSTSAQSFSHGSGVSYMKLKGSGVDMNAYGVVYAPRINFKEMKEWASLSIGTKLAWAVSRTEVQDFSNLTNVSTREVTTLVVDVPLLVGLNLGAGATRERTDGMLGAFINAGLGFNIRRFSYVNELEQKIKQRSLIFGPAFYGGFRFRVKGKLASLGASFLQGLTKNNKIKVFGFRGIYYFN